MLVLRKNGEKFYSGSFGKDVDKSFFTDDEKQRAINCTPKPVIDPHILSFESWQNYYYNDLQVMYHMLHTYLNGFSDEPSYIIKPYHFETLEKEFAKRLYQCSSNKRKSYLLFR